MTREMKYRVWDNENKSYNDPYSSAYYAMAQDGGLDFYVHGDHWKGADPDTYVVEQYTGLKDKNGKEIYEGDIVKVYTWTNLTKGMEYRYTTKVFWQERYAQFNTTYNDALSNEITQDFFEVIGNIHENPELLEGED